MRSLMLFFAVTILFGLMGCSSGTTPDQPATLTPEQEQEILRQVENTSQQEDGAN